MKIQRGTIRYQLEAMQAQGLSDAEMAHQLGVSVSCVWWWRDRCGLPVTDKLATRFERRYGRGSFARLERLLRTGATLRTIADTFGFSRQYASELAQRLGYTRAAGTIAPTKGRSDAAAP